MLDFGVLQRKHNEALRFTPPQKEDVTSLLVTFAAVGVGSRLGPLIQSQASLKSVAHTIKLADGFMKGARTISKLHSPTPANLVFLTLETAKALSKGASKGLVVKNKSACFRKIFKGLKASEGALNLVKYSNVLNYYTADPLELVVKGYKLTKSAFNVFDGVNGVRSAAAVGYEGIKEGMEGVGLVVKSMVLYKQTQGFLIQGLRISNGLWEALRNNNNEEELSEEKTQKRSPRQRRGFGLQSGNPCVLGCCQNLGLRYLLGDGHGHPEQSLGSIFFLSLPSQPDQMCR